MIAGRGSRARLTASVGCLLLPLCAAGCDQFNAGMDDMFARLLLGLTCVWGALGLVGRARVLARRAVGVVGVGVGVVDLVVGLIGGLAVVV